MKRNHRRQFLAAAGALLAAPLAARAQAWPAKPVRVVVGFPAGGLTDVLARAYSEHLAQKLGQGFLVENKPGAGSMIACAEVAGAARRLHVPVHHLDRDEPEPGAVQETALRPG
jgi:tripartite-type tricarboxylate transporter receptor subunit TctC